MKIRDGFVLCEKCGKKLIKKLPNGLYHFMYGRRGEFIPVDIRIQGVIQMKCTSPTECGHINILSEFNED